MALLRRRTPLPADVRDRLDLPTGDRVVAAGRLEDGWAVASLLRLHLVRDDGSAQVRAWSDVDGARLDPEAATLTVTWVDGTSATTLHLTDTRDDSLARAVHERVQSSVVHRENVTLPRGEVVRVVLRRDADGALLTQVIGTGAVDLRDPATAAAVDAAEARVREAAGL